jgi:hypothetical protein
MLGVLGLLDRHNVIELHCFVHVTLGAVSVCMEVPYSGKGVNCEPQTIEYEPERGSSEGVA